MTNLTAKVTGIQFKDKAVRGTFPVVRVEKDLIVIRHPEHGNLRVSRQYATLPDAVGVTLSYDELIREIAGRFAILDSMISGVIAKKIRSVIVSGAPGVGKTYTIETKLEEAKAAGKITRYVIVRGAVSPISLYILMWQHRHEGNVIVLDDSDSIFFDEVGANLIKAATDSSKRRHVSYYKEASTLADQGIPKTFEYHGAIIVATNLDFEHEVANKTKAGTHLSAILNRALYLDLGLHSKQALMARVEHVCRTTPMLRKEGLTESQIDDVVDWIKSNQATVRSLSIRTAGHIADLVMTDPTGWKHVAKATLLTAKQR